MSAQFDRRIFADLNWALLLAALACTTLGVINIFSTGMNTTGVEQTPLYLKQLQWAGIGFVVMVIVATIDYRTIARHAYLFYLISVILLILVDILGYQVRGSQRWINIFGFFLQPSEIMKISLVLVLARYFDGREKKDGYGIKDLFPPLMLVALPFFLILKQPDLGTAMIIGAIFFSMLVLVGVKRREALLGLLFGVFTLPFFWFILKDYQKARIMTFIDPSRDPFGSGYHIIQSIIAVGSGKILGKGFMQGSQTQLKFLPEQQTDFIFSVFAEEWGLIGVLILLFLLLHIILSGVKIARSSYDYLGALLAIGITSIIFWEVFINIGMVIGLMPVVGIPLPFMSYGGSSMVLIFLCIGLLLNINMRRFLLQK